MDEVILSRLKLFINKIESLIETGLAILHQMKNGDENVNFDEAQIVSNKLKSAIDRFVSELYYYYKMVEQPSVDILSSYTETQIKGEELISELNFLTQKKTQTDTDHGSKINSLNVTSKLPKMELAKFHGDVLQWHQFWDQFCSNVDSRNISDVDKLLYLQSALEGEAKSTIEGLDMTNKNYDIAVSTLKDRYGKPSLVIDAHYAALYRIKAADSSSIVDCRRVLNEIERHLRVLGSLGEDVNHNHLRFMILQKFSGDITYELRLKMDTTETGNIENLRRNLERIISARESSELMKKEVNLEQPSQKSANNNFTLETLHVGSETGRHTNFSVNERGKFVSKRHFPSKGGGHTKKIYNRREERCFQGKNSNNSTKFDTRKRQHQQEESEPERKRKRPTCIFCGGGHFNDECKEARTIEERKRRLKGRCYNCLSKGHQSAECRSNMKCRHCGKYGEHNRALCPAKCQTKTDALHVNGPNGIKGVTALQTAIIYILKKGEEDKTLPCRVLLDCGSQRTYVTKELAKKFNLPELETNNLLVFTFGSDRPTELESPVVELNFHTRTNNHRRIYANVVPHITNRVPTVFDIVKRDIGSKDLTLADDASLGDRVDILIGNDYYFNFVNSQKKQISEHLYLVDTIFGWVWSGNFPVASEGKQDLLTVLTYFQSSIDCGGLNKPDLPLRSDDMKRLWDLESIGITESPKLTRDEDTIRQFNETTKFFDNRYQVKWPWIEYPPSLPSNFGLAYGRLNSLQKRLDNETAQSYDEILRDQLDKGIIEEVSNPKAPVDHPVHYLPHHCIKQGQKLRLVYDASSKIKDNKSLNECLYRGPLLLEDLTGLLIRFRSYRIGIVADVEKAFLQIGLQEEDRDVTRFLWPKDIDKPLTADNLSHKLGPGKGRDLFEI